MAIFKACLPHSTRMGKNPTLHFMLHKYISDSCMTYTCDTIDMDHVMLDIVVHDCMGLASFLEVPPPPLPAPTPCNP